MEVPTAPELDAILALQLTVAWAGEAGEPRRLGWWSSDLVDPDAGGDFFARLLPHTGPWAALCSVRELARRAEERGLRSLGDEGSCCGLYSLGFAVDERLDARLRAHKRSGASTAALPWPVPLTDFSLPALRTALALEPAPYLTRGDARELVGARPASSLRAARALASALLEPASASYPLPHFRLRP